MSLCTRPRLFGAFDLPKNIYPTYENGCQDNRQVPSSLFQSKNNIANKRCFSASDPSIYDIMYRTPSRFLIQRNHGATSRDWCISHR